MQRTYAHPHRHGDIPSISRQNIPAVSLLLTACMLQAVGCAARELLLFSRDLITPFLFQFVIRSMCATCKNMFRSSGTPSRTCIKPTQLGAREARRELLSLFRARSTVLVSKYKGLVLPLFPQVKVKIQRIVEKFTRKDLLARSARVLHLKDIDIRYKFFVRTKRPRPNQEGFVTEDRIP